MEARSQVFHINMTYHLWARGWAEAAGASLAQLPYQPEAKAQIGKCSRPMAFSSCLDLDCIMAMAPLSDQRKLTTHRRREQSETPDHSA